MRTRVLPLSTSTALPALPVPSTHTRIYPLLLFACDALSWRRARSLNATDRRDITRDAMSRNFGNRNSVTCCPSSHEKGGTYLGGMPDPNTFAPAPTTVPVVSRVPIPVFAWSPSSDPSLFVRVSCSPLGVHSCTEP